MVGSLESLKETIRALGANWRRPAWWRQRVDDRINTPIQQFVRPRSKATDVLDEEWDTLVILDACRADLFERRIDTEQFDEAMTVTSPASETAEWLNYTFDGAHGDIVYVAGNPMVSNVVPDSFHSLVEAWRDGWDPSTGIIRPEAVTAAAIEARERFPNKRLVVHYMQPHAPFIDHPELNYSTNFDDLGLVVGENTPTTTRTRDALTCGTPLRRSTLPETPSGRDTRHVRRGDGCVETLLETFSGRIVVTSDHGNAFGERAGPCP